MAFRVAEPIPFGFFASPNPIDQPEPEPNRQLAAEPNPEPQAVFVAQPLPTTIRFEQLGP